MATVIITAVQWDAVALAQGNFGVPDSLLGQILNCNASVVRHARGKGGWGIRDLAKAHSGLTGWRRAEGKMRQRKDAEAEAGKPGQQPTPAGSAPVHDVKALLANMEEPEADRAENAAQTLERLTAALALQLQAAAEGRLDAAALKRVDSLVAAGKTFEKLLAMKSRPATDDLLADAYADAQAVEDKRQLLLQMDRRIDELAEQRALELQNGQTGTGAD